MVGLAVSRLLLYDGMQALCGWHFAYFLQDNLSLDIERHMLPEVITVKVNRAHSQTR